jgi:hypothetical protein
MPKTIIINLQIDSVDSVHEAEHLPIASEQEKVEYKYISEIPTDESVSAIEIPTAEEAPKFLASGAKSEESRSALPKDDSLKADDFYYTDTLELKEE